MLNAHRRLYDHFASIRSRRPEHPIYLLEHGETPPAVTKLSRDVGVALEVHSIDSSFWRERYLPLLVVATEIGYDYRGTGTDFWPRFEERLERKLPPSGRQALTSLFEEASRTLGAATPPQTRWARTFCHIAWPISHAVLPRDLQPCLARALGQLGFQVTADTPAARIVEALRSGARRFASGRFFAWLEQAALVAAVVRGFFEVTEDEVLEPRVSSRLRNDLQNEPDAYDDLCIARERQERIRQAPARQSSARRGPAVRVGVLSFEDISAGQPMLVAQLPRLGGDDELALRRTSRHLRYTPRLWGLARPIPGDHLLCGLPFRLTLDHHLPPAGTALLPGLEQIGFDSSARGVLDSYELDLARPLLFYLDRGGERVRQIRRKSVTSGTRCWVLADPDDANREPYRSSPAPRGSEVLGLFCWLVDTGDAIHADWMRSIGFEVRERPQISLVGASLCGVATSAATFDQGDLIALSVQSAPSAGASVASRRGAPVPVTTGDLLVVEAATGGGELEIRVGGSVVDRVEVRVEDQAGPPGPVAWARLDPEAPSISALLGKRVGISVEALLPLDGVDIELELGWDGGRSRASSDLPSLPCVVSGSHAIWTELVSDARREEIALQTELSLTVRVGRLFSHVFRLEEPLAHFWWEDDDSGPRPVNDDGEMAMSVIHAAVPWSPPAPAAEQSGEALHLRLANEDGLVVPGAGMCDAPRSLRFSDRVLPRPARLLRRLVSQGDALGAGALASAYLQWATATATHALAEIERGRLVRHLGACLVEMLCGRQWACAEQAMARESATEFWTTLFQRCRARGVGYDAMAPIDHDEQGSFQRAVRCHVGGHIPDLWERLDDRSEETAELLAEVFDDGFCRAYEELAEARCRSGREGHEALAAVDPGTAPEDWRAVLDDTASQATADRLHALLCPPTAADELRRLDYVSMTLGETVDELTRWTRAYQTALQGRLWNREELEAMLQLWVSPDRAAGNRWRGAIERALVDRWTARAVRYSAVRYLMVRDARSATWSNSNLDVEAR